MAAPPTSLTGTFVSRAAVAIRSASAMTSATGTLVSVVSSALLHVHDDRLEVGHLFDRAIAADSADAALLPGAAAKRDMRFPVIGGLVHVHPSGLEPLREAQRTVDITRVDGAEQAIW